MDKLQEIKNALIVPEDLRKLIHKDTFKDLNMGAPSPSGALNIGIHGLLFAQVTNAEIANAIVTLFNNADYLIKTIEELQTENDKLEEYLESTGEFN